jgi:glutamine---fructose-6-phosphate transaminase (isomerizing)
MKTEILAQPAALQATIDALVPRVPEIADLAKSSRQVLFFARGTSDNAAVYGSYLIQIAAGRLASLGSPSVATAYHAKIDLSGTMAVGLSQSGRTHEIIETLRWARHCGAQVVAITNSGDSPLADLADVALVTEAGIERAVPATKTFTCQLAALAVLSIGLGADLDVAELRRLPAAIADLLAEATAPGYGVDSIVDELVDVDGLVVSARGLAYSTALELALKIKEACYLHAMGLSYADLQHGPIAVVDAATPAIVIAADSGPTVDAAVGLARRVTQAGARAYAIGGGAALASAASKALAGPALPEWLAPIGLIVPGQLLTEALSRRLGIDPDSPRGLSKITQTT